MGKNSYILQLSDDEIKELMGLLTPDSQLEVERGGEIKRHYEIKRKDDGIYVELYAGAVYCVFCYGCTLYNFCVDNDSLCSSKRRANTKNIFVKFMLRKFGKQYGEDYVENCMRVAKEEINNAWGSLNNFNITISGLPESNFSKSSSKAFQLVSDTYNSVTYPGGKKMLRQQLTDYVQNLLDELNAEQNL